MLKVKVYNQEAEAVGERELSQRVFGVKASPALIHQAVVAQLANERQVLAHTKDRSEVRGGGRKPWRQKGTGRARAGSTRSPIWIGGGVTFGPTKDRNFSKKINKKMKQQAILMALSDRLASDNLAVLDKIEIAEFKTKKFNQILNKLEDKILKTKKEKVAKRSILVVLDKKNQMALYSGRNLAGAAVINLDNINLIDLLKYRDLVLTVEGIKKLEKIYSK